MKSGSCLCSLILAPLPKSQCRLPLKDGRRIPSACPGRKRAATWRTSRGNPCSACLRSFPILARLSERRIPRPPSTPIGIETVVSDVTFFSKDVLKTVGVDLNLASVHNPIIVVAFGTEIPHSSTKSRLFFSAFRSKSLIAARTIESKTAIVSSSGFTATCGRYRWHAVDSHLAARYSVRTIFFWHI